MKIIITNYTKQKTTNLQKKKQYELNKQRALIRQQNESNNEIRQYEKKQKRENIIEGDIDLDKFFELASSDKIYVTGLNLHESKNENLLDYKGDFDLNGLFVIGPVER